MDTAFLEEAGYNAFRLGLTSFDAPYRPGTPNIRAWMRGYERAKRGHARPMEVSAPNKPKPSTTVAPSGTPSNTRRRSNSPRPAQPWKNKGGGVRVQ